MPGRQIPLRQLLMDRHPWLSPDQAWARIAAGSVRLGEETLRDPAALVPAEAQISLEGERPPSRGQQKIGPVLDALGIACQGRVGLDAGAAAGGFTAALLERGAAAVHAIDVGYNLIDYRLRTDPRVILHERTNIMHVRLISPEPEFAVCDLSFRSLTGAASHILAIPRVQWLLALIKPQFEADPGEVPRGGVIVDRGLRQRIVDRSLGRLEREGLRVVTTRWSALAGSSGNLECFALLEPGDQPPPA